MQTATKKPVKIQFVKYDGDNHQDIITFTNGEAHFQQQLGSAANGEDYPQVYDRLVIKTLEGEMLVSKGDYVIRGIKGEFYPCKPDIFLGSYDIDNPEL